MAREQTTSNRMFFRTSALLCCISQKIGEQSSKTLAAREQNTVNFPATLTAVCSVHCPSQSTCLFHYNVSPLHKATQPAMFKMLVTEDCSNRSPRITSQHHKADSLMKSKQFLRQSRSSPPFTTPEWSPPCPHQPPNVFTSCTTLIHPLNSTTFLWSILTLPLTTQPYLIMCAE